ncbi:hypothetical protein [uncultured Corynebacterium sp.]|uniref:hypothetical protein n=1 Tax=uncultured Corynebacterium sp. TaxID=159447 RepID=UPI0025ECCE73|nr:hypothetical protein [uncultured Corynebacterium sp.]
MTTLDRPACADAVAVADAVVAVPAVVGLVDGRHGEISLLYPGHRVRGLRWSAGRLEIHVCAGVDPRDPRPLAETCGLVRDAASRALARPVPIDVIVADAAPAVTGSRPRELPTDLED